MRRLTRKIAIGRLGIGKSVQVDEHQPGDHMLEWVQNFGELFGDVAIS